MLRRSLMIHPADSVVCVLEDAKKGDTVRPPDGAEVTLLEDIEFAHKVCIKDLKKGGPGVQVRGRNWLHADRCAQGDLDPQPQHGL